MRWRGDRETVRRRKETLRRQLEERGTVRRPWGDREGTMRRKETMRRPLQDSKQIDRQKEDSVETMRRPKEKRETGSSDRKGDIYIMMHT